MSNDRVLRGATDYDKLQDLGSKTYKEQAVWFLNAFWNQFAKNETEKIWDYKHKFDQLDLEKKAQGHALDELNAHRFLESFNETLTVHAMREKLRATGAITDRPKLVPLTHYLLFKYQADFHFLVNAPQGSQEEIIKAQKMLEEVQAAFRIASEREDEARAREAEARAAQRELEAALAELKAQEDAFNNRTEQLKRATTTGGLVSQNKAKNELAQHLSSDPLPLRRAKITQEAAVNKAEKATRAAEEARAAAEAAVEEASRRVAEAEAYLEEAKSKGSPEGAIWWLERELHEAKAYLPASKGGYKKEK